MLGTSFNTLDTKEPKAVSHKEHPFMKGEIQKDGTHYKIRLGDLKKCKQSIKCYNKQLVYEMMS